MKAKVIDLAKHKHGKLVLDAFDKLERAKIREVAQKRKAVEQAAKKRI